MQTVIEKAAVLMDALPFIQRFRGETIVVKFGGSIMDDEQGVQAILHDVAFMECVGLRPVLVHGGGKMISARMKAAGLVPRFVRGLRVTDEPAMRIVEQVLNVEINPRMVEQLERFGCRARGIHGDDILKVVKHVGRDPESGHEIDWGYVGEVLQVDVEPIRAFLNAEMCPILTPLGRGADRQVYNINADDAASAVARAIQARKLVFLSDVPGLLADPSDPASVISSVKVGEVEELIRREVITGGMLPKISGAVNAVRAGVQKVHIIDSAMPHSLLLELFTEQGVGTEIIQ
jgi:acetylglutamate kinase